MPDLAGSVLFLDDDEGTNDVEFDRDLQSLLQQQSFPGVRGIVLGRFQKASQMNQEKLRAIVTTKKKLGDIPIIAGADFGHTTPSFTFPVGGTVVIDASSEQTKIIIQQH